MSYLVNSPSRTLRVLTYKSSTRISVKQPYFLANTWLPTQPGKSDQFLLALKVFAEDKVLLYFTGNLSHLLSSNKSKFQYECAKK